LSKPETHAAPRSCRAGAPRRDRAGGPTRAAEERRLFVRYRLHGDLAARDQIVDRFLPLARQLARRYRRANEPMEDLEQVAALGLLKAIGRFDLEYRTAFSSFAVPTILGELKRHFRDSGWAAHVPRELQERVMRVNRANEALSRDNGRPPTVAQIASHTSRTEAEVLEALDAASAYNTVPLERPASGDDEDGCGPQDRIGRTDAGYDLVEYGASIAGTVDAMPVRERRMLHMRFVEDMSQSEIAERVGISQMHVSRLLRGALDELRAAAAH